MICTASDTFRILAYWELCLFRYIQVYSSISALLRHIHAYWAIIKAYLDLFRDMQNSEWPSHIYNLVIFWALIYLEPVPCSKLCKTLTKHIHNPSIVRTVYSGIFQPCSSACQTLCNACICRNPTYSESWNIQNPTIIAFWRMFRTLSRLQK